MVIYKKLFNFNQSLIRARKPAPEGICHHGEQLSGACH